MPRLVRRVLLALIALGIAGFLGVLAFYGFLASERGRSWLAHRIERVYDEEFQGSLRIGRIESLVGLSVDATDVAFLDPTGREIIEIPRAHLGVSLADAFAGRLRLVDGRASEGRVLITSGRVLETSIEEAFASRHPPGGDPLDFDTGVIAVERTTLLIAMGGPRVRLGALRGSLRVAREGERAVRVSFDDFAGRLSLPGFDALEARAFRARGEVVTERDPILDLRARACFDRGDIPLRIRFAPGRLHMRFDSSENRLVGFALRLAGLGEVIESERGEVDVRGVGRC